jgi:hypothetical protein
MKNASLPKEEAQVYMQFFVSIVKIPYENIETKVSVI